VGLCTEDCVREGGIAEERRFTEACGAVEDHLAEVGAIEERSLDEVGGVMEPRVANPSYSPGA
jgi:hypothetical protein